MQTPRPKIFFLLLYCKPSGNGFALYFLVTGSNPVRVQHIFKMECIILTF